MPSVLLCLSLLVFASFVASLDAATYIIDSVTGLHYDGIGGLSGGGATSRLLVDYSDPYRSQILDYLFKPSFGANIQILKVEIGGDAQSTEGTESSHMHYKGDENYDRGYEWWLMKEAKARNPDIVLYGLSWTWPRWLGEGTNNPLTNTTVHYIISWLIAAESHHNLTIDYIGVWNENAYSRDYIVSLKTALSANNLKTKLVASDDCCSSTWNICSDLNKDSQWAKYVDVVGGHYPNGYTTDDCQTLLANTGIPLWSSEDFSSYFKAGACWTRLLNRNYIIGNLTSTIAWNLIAAYYDELPYSGDGLMHAPQPWSGFYEVDQVIWSTAHTTQFTDAKNWRYLKAGYGAGRLQNGGTYVGLTDGNGGLTITVESMTHDASGCVHEPAPDGNVTNQSVTFLLQGSFANIKNLHVFSSSFASSSTDSEWFQYLGFLPVANQSITIQLNTNMLYTLSTRNGSKGHYPVTATSSHFPLPYADRFDGYDLHSQAFGFTDQAGSFEVVAASDIQRGNVLRQMVNEEPITWCGQGPDPLPFSIIGDHSWANIHTQVDVYIENQGTAFLAAAVTQGGCLGLSGSAAIVFAISTTNTYKLATDTALHTVVHSGNTTIAAKTWYTLTLDVSASGTVLYLNHEELYSTKAVTSKSSGWIAIGSDWNWVQYDQFSVTASINSNPFKEEQQYHIYETADS